jgi:DnaJ-class molecular chaperone
MPVMPELDGKKPGDEDVPGSKPTGEHICPTCGGTGKLDQELCPDCDGSGQMTMIVGDA